MNLEMDLCEYQKFDVGIKPVVSVVWWLGRLSLEFAFAFAGYGGRGLEPLQRSNFSHIFKVQFVKSNLKLNISKFILDV